MRFIVVLYFWTYGILYSPQDMKFFLGRFGMQIITNQFQKELKQHGNEQFPFLVSYQKLSEYESGSFMWHWHPEIEITYVQKIAKEI